MNAILQGFQGVKLFSLHAFMLLRNKPKKHVVRMNLFDDDDIMMVKNDMVLIKVEVTVTENRQKKSGNTLPLGRFLVV